MSLGRDVLNREEPFLLSASLSQTGLTFWSHQYINTQPEPVLSSPDPNERQAVALNTSSDFIAQRVLSDHDSLMSPPP